MANKTKKRAASAAIAGRNGHSLISDEKFKQLYATLLKQRLLEQHLQLTGQLHGQLHGQLPGHFAGRRSQEAASTALVIDLQPEDTLVLSSASHHTAFIKGTPLHAVSRHSQARPDASDSHFHHTHLNVMTLGSSADKRLSVATGAALASKMVKKNAITVVFLDVESEDAAALLSRGQEALEIASAHALPIIYVLNNEAGVMPAGLSSGCPIITVDGNDVVAVYRVAQESIERARQGGGPTLIESRPFHYVGQSIADAQDDTVMNMEKYLTAKSLFSDAWKQQLIAEFREELAAASEENASLLHGVSPRVKNGAILESPAEEFRAHDLASSTGEDLGRLSSFT